eukprot:GDKI01027504.1.p1 GENE.GDKI01027504.1~~GDKI01027504.1.p1  ORF type:complete len:432 (-),score=33.40 GDKI01027504.1:42-1337(-)
MYLANACRPFCRHGLTRSAFLGHLTHTRRLPSLFGAYNSPISSIRRVGTSTQNRAQQTQTLSTHSGAFNEPEQVCIEKRQGTYALEAAARDLIMNEFRKAGHMTEKCIEGTTRADMVVSKPGWVDSKGQALWAGIQLKSCGLADKHRFCNSRLTRADAKYRGVVMVFVTLRDSEDIKIWVRDGADMLQTTVEISANGMHDKPEHRADLNPASPHYVVRKVMQLVQTRSAEFPLQTLQEWNAEMVGESLIAARRTRLFHQILPDSIVPVEPRVEGRTVDAEWRLGGSATHVDTQYKSAKWAEPALVTFIRTKCGRRREMFRYTRDDFDLVCVFVATTRFLSAELPCEGGETLESVFLLTTQQLHQRKYFGETGKQIILCYANEERAQRASVHGWTNAHHIDVSSPKLLAGAQQQIWETAEQVAEWKRKGRQF